MDMQAKLRRQSRRAALKFAIAGAAAAALAGIGAASRALAQARRCRRAR